MNISQKIEALLFWKAEPVSIKKMASILKVDEATINDGLGKLENDLKDRGICLIRDKDEVTLGTIKEFSSIIEESMREELNRDLGKAGLETLSIILYEGPISRTDIDYIRGVNSQFILRHLLIRGLVERIENPKDARVFLYKPTLSLLSYLGIKKIEELPEYEQVRSEIETFKKNQQQEIQ